MSNQSDRIRAALSKSDVPKSSGEPAGPLPNEERTAERPAEAETSRHPSIAVNDEVLEALLRPGPATRRPLFENMQDVESSLGMLAKNDQTRAAAPSAVATPPVAPPVSKIEQPGAKPAAPAVEKPAAPVTERPIEKSQPAPVSPTSAATVAATPKTAGLGARDAKPAATVLKPAPKPAATEAKDPAPLKASLPVNDKILEKVEALHATFGTIEQPKSESSKLPLIIGAVVVIAGLSAFFLRGHFATAKAPVTAAAAPAFPLQLELQPQANGMINIRWNPDTPPVTNARDGRMVITERDQAPKTVPLEIAQLKMGHLYFQTSSDRVEFRLEVVDHSGAVTQESVMALSSGTPADATAGVNPQAQNAAFSAKPQNNAQAAPNVQVPAGSVPPSAPKTPIRTFTMPPPATSASQEGRVILPDAPVISGVVTGGAAVSSPAVRLPDAGAAPPPSRQTSPGSTQPIRVGGTVQNANLIRRVTPVYPEMALRARVQGTVRFSAVIGKGGAIQDLQLISGPSLLVQSAVDAVKQWVYRPTLLNGEPVEVITQIEVNFTLTK